jgi:hypothetical protein
MVVLMRSKSCAADAASADAAIAVVVARFSRALSL